MPAGFALFLSAAFMKFPEMSMDCRICDGRIGSEYQIIHGFFAKFLIIPLTRAGFGDII